MFTCPDCNADTLAIITMLELPPDARSDEITVQLVRCGACGFMATAVYEESRRGASESWHHDGYPLSADDYHFLHNLMQQCPTPKDKRCECIAHRTLNQRDERGCWWLPQGVRKKRPFALIIPEE